MISFSVWIQLSKGQKSIVKSFSDLVQMHFDIARSVYGTLSASLSQNGKRKGKGKAAPLQAWSGPEGSRKLRFQDFMTTAQDDGKVASLTHRPPLPPGNTPGTHFC